MSEFLPEPSLSSLELTKVLGHVTSTIEAVLPASLNFRSVQ